MRARRACREAATRESTGAAYFRGRAVSDAAWRDGDAGVSVETVSRMLGIPIPTIRTWERRYGVPTPARTAGGHRRYSHADALELRAMRDEIGRGRDAADAAALLLERRAS